MVSFYDYNKGTYRGTVRGGITFDLVIRTPITQICGESGTGKTFLVNHINNERRNSSFNSFGSSNAIAFDMSNIDSLSVERLMALNHSLIVIDRCDLLLTDTRIIDFISRDRNNHYLLFSRTALPLGLSPNYYGEFVFKGGVISIYYRYNEKGWF